MGERGGGGGGGGVSVQIWPTIRGGGYTNLGGSKSEVTYGIPNNNLWAVFNHDNIGRE